jgi:hypothetical protein
MDDLGSVTLTAELADALVAGVDRAQREGALRGLEATALRFGLKAGALTGILGLIVPP